MTSMVSNLAIRDKLHLERISGLEADCDELRDAVIVRETCGSWERVPVKASAQHRAGGTGREFRPG